MLGRKQLQDQKMKEEGKSKQEKKKELRRKDLCFSNSNTSKRFSSKMTTFNNNS